LPFPHGVENEYPHPRLHALTAHSTDEAARLAAATPYGLSLAVITRDVMSGLRLAERVPIGMVHINDQTSTDEPIAPFGGVGQSGAKFENGWSGSR
jgi:benzaldehyde dehydrogenase (NAD)